MIGASPVPKYVDSWTIQGDETNWSSPRTRTINGASILRVLQLDSQGTPLSLLALWQDLLGSPRHTLLSTPYRRPTITLVLTLISWGCPLVALEHAFDLHSPNHSFLA